MLPYDVIFYLTLPLTPYHIVKTAFLVFVARSLIKKTSNFLKPVYFMLPFIKNYKSCKIPFNRVESHDNEISVFSHIVIMRFYSIKGYFT